MLDVLLGLSALWLVDVGGAAPYQVGTALAVWTEMGVLGGLLIIPLLTRVRGLAYVRFSALVELALFPAFLLVSPMWAKLTILGLWGLLSAGWYSILRAQLYSAMPGRSGTVMTVSNVFELVGGLIPLGLGFVAERFGLTATVRLLLLGPIALLMGVPGCRSQASQ